MKECKGKKHREGGKKRKVKRADGKEVKREKTPK